MIIVSYFIYKNFPISFSIERTFWMKRPYAIVVWVKTSENSKKGIFAIRIRNYNKASKWDSEQFHNGNYHKQDAKSKLKKKAACTA